MQQQEQQFDKLWKILDDCIQNNKFKQIYRSFSDKECGRCAAGVFLSYMGWDGKDNSDFTFGENIGKLENKYNIEYYSIPSDFFEKYEEEYKSYRNHRSLIRLFKDIYSKSGKVSMNIIIALNDTSRLTFEQIRDMLKQIDV